MIKYTKYIILIIIIMTSCTTVDYYKFQGWQVFEYDNIEVLYRKPNYSNSFSPDMEFIKGVAEEQSNAIRKAEGIIGKKINYPISIYLYNQDDEKVASNPNGGKAILQSNTVIYSYDASSTFSSNGEKYYLGTHEIAHIIFGNEYGKTLITCNLLLAEGIAVWFADGYQKIGIRTKKYNALNTYRKSLDHWMNQYSNLLPSLNEVIDTQNIMKEALFYPIAGMFVKYLYDVYGVNVIKQLYQASNDALGFSIKSLLKKDLSEIDKEFNIYVNEYIKEHKVVYLEK